VKGMISATVRTLLPRVRVRVRRTMEQGSYHEKKLYHDIVGYSQAGMTINRTGPHRTAPDYIE